MIKSSYIQRDLKDEISRLGLLVQYDDVIQTIKRFKQHEWCAVYYGDYRPSHSNTRFIFDGVFLGSTDRSRGLALSETTIKLLEEQANELAPHSNSKVRLEVAPHITEKNVICVRVSNMLDDIQSIQTYKQEIIILGWTDSVCKSLMNYGDLKCRIITDSLTGAPMVAAFYEDKSKIVVALVTNPSQVYYIAGQVLLASNVQNLRNCETWEDGLINRIYPPTTVRFTRTGTRKVRLDIPGVKIDRAKTSTFTAKVDLVGTYYCDEDARNGVSDLENDDIVYGVFDPQNEHDHFAIRVDDDIDDFLGMKLGYVAKKDTHAIRRFINVIVNDENARNQIFSGQLAVPLRVKRVRSGYGTGCISLLADYKTLRYYSDFGQYLVPCDDED